MKPFTRLCLEEHADLEKLRADFPLWVFSVIPGPGWHMPNGLIIIEARPEVAAGARRAL